MLADYYQRYGQLSDKEIAHRAAVKEMQIRQVFAAVGQPSFPNPLIRLAVLGSGDKRLVDAHRRIFETVFGKPVTMTTFDIDVEHLAGAQGGVIRHDVTEPLPETPYEVVYGDVIVRFVEPTKQFFVMKNAFDALAPGGIAVVNFAQEDFDPPPKYEPVAGTFRVDMNALQLEMAKAGIPFLEVPVRVETTKPGTDDKMIINEMSLVMRRG